MRESETTKGERADTPETTVVIKVVQLALFSVSEICLSKATLRDITLNLNVDQLNLTTSTSITCFRLYSLE